MGISQTRRGVIDEIMSITFEPYDVGWCKAEVIAEMAGMSRDDTALIAAYQEQTGSLDRCREIIRLFLSDCLTYYTPERFEYLDLVRSNWVLARDDEHVRLSEQIAAASHSAIDRQRRAARDDIASYLSLWNLPDMAAYERAPRALEDEIDLARFLSNHGYTKHGEPQLEFTDYDHLQMLFSDRLFEPATVRFFRNTTASEVAAAIAEGRMPAVVGLDREVIGVLWFMT